MEPNPCWDRMKTGDFETPASFSLAVRWFGLRQMRYSSAMGKP